MEMTDDGRVHFWNTSGWQTSIVSTHNDLTSLALSTDGTLLATAGSNGIVQIWQVTDQSAVPPERMQFQEGGVSSVAFSPDGERIAAGSVDGSIRIWFINPGANSE
jgi:WD40 repeat protein